MRSLFRNLALVFVIILNSIIFWKWSFPITLVGTSIMAFFQESCIADLVSWFLSLAAPCVTFTRIYIIEEKNWPLGHTQTIWVVLIICSSKAGIEVRHRDA